MVTVSRSDKIPSMLLSLKMYPLKQWTKCRVILVYAPYPNLFKGLPFLECFNTVLGIKVTEILLRTMPLRWNEFIVLTLRVK